MTRNRREQLLHCPLFSCTTRCCKHVKELLFDATPVAKSGAKVLPFLILANFLATFFHPIFRLFSQKLAYLTDIKPINRQKKFSKKIRFFLVRLDFEEFLPQNRVSHPSITKAEKRDEKRRFFRIFLSDG